MSKKLSFSTLILSIILLLAVCFTPVKALHAEQIAVDYEVEDLSLSYSFELHEDGYYISAYKGKEVNIELPDYYDGIPVTGIADAPVDEGGGVFYKTNIMQVKLGENIKYIGRGAFRECDKLENVITNQALEEINSYAFYNCSALKEIDFPKLKAVGWHAFDGAGLYKPNDSDEGITDYYYQNENNKILLRVMEIDRDSYEVEEGTHLIAQQAFYPTLQLNKLILPTSIEYLGDFLIGGRTASDNEGYLTNFTDCEIEIKGGSLQEFVSNVAFGEASFALVGETTNAAGASHVYYIGKTAVLADEVKKEPYLRERVIIDGTEKIAKGAFKGNSTLEKITIPSTVTYIGKDAFKDCKKLTEVIIEGNVVIDSNAFSGCENLTKVIGNIIEIKSGAFSNCTSLTSIELPKVTFIGEFAFGGSGLTEVKNLADGADIRERAFSKTKLSADENGLITAGNHVLGVKKGITKVTVTNKKIADMAFDGSSLEEVTLVGAELGKGSFFNCSYLETVSYDGTVIPEDCFYGTRDLKNLYLQNNITEIGNRAFYDSHISSFNFSNVKTVGDYAFGASKLTSANLGVETQLVDYAFFNTPLTEITVAEGNANYQSENGILYNKDKTKLLVFPAEKELESLSLEATVVAKGAFAYSQKLKSIEGTISQVEDMAFYNSSVTALSGENIEKVGYKAFYGSELASISLPKLKQSGYKSFAYCTNLKSIALTNGEFKRGFAILKGCSGLTELKISLMDGGQSQAKTYNIGYLFGADFYESSVQQVQRYSDIASLKYYLPKIEKITVTDGRIAYGALMNLKYLKQVEISENVSDIGPYAFMGCSALEEVNLNDRIVLIPSNSFSECSSLKKIDLKNIQKIDEFAFSRCYALQEITVSDKLMYIGSGAFSQADSLTKVNITSNAFFDNFNNDTSDYGLMFEVAETVTVAGESLTEEQIASLREIKVPKQKGLSRMEITMIILAALAVILVVVYILTRFVFVKKEDDFTRPRRKNKRKHQKHNQHSHRGHSHSYHSHHRSQEKSAENEEINDI